MTQQYINFKRARNFGDKLNATFAFISMNMGYLLKNVLFVAGPFALLAGVCFSVYQSYTVGMLGKQVPTTDISATMALGVAVILMMITMMIATTMVIAIVQRTLRHYVEQGTADLTPAYFWKNIWGEFFSVLGSAIGFVVLLSIMITLLIAPLFLMISSGVRAPAIIVLIVLIAFLALLLVGATLMLIYPIRNFERKNFFTAVGRSFVLNKGKWWSTAGLMFVTYIIQTAILFIFMIPMYGIMIVKMLHLQDAESVVVDSGIGIYDILGAISGALYMLGFTVAGSLFFIAITFQYFNLREHKEASGLLERMQSFGVSQTVHEEEEQY